MRPRLAHFAVAILALGLIAAGCGGDDETTTSSTTAAAGATGATGLAGEPLSEQEFLAQGNEICKSGDKEIESEADSTFGQDQPSDQELEAFIEDVVVPGTQDQIDAIRALSPPEEIAEDVTTLLDDAQDALDEIEADPTILTGGGPDPFKDVNKQAEALGLDECTG